LPVHDRKAEEVASQGN